MTTAERRRSLMNYRITEVENGFVVTEGALGGPNASFGETWVATTVASLALLIGALYGGVDKGAPERPPGRADPSGRVVPPHGSGP